MSVSRLLVVNADDFGFTTDVNEGIVEAHCRGIVTATSLMANAPAFDHALDLARANPTLDIGCHLTLVGGVSLLPPYKRLPPTLADLMWALARRQVCVYDEFLAQVRRIVHSGIAPSHLDTHKHTHMLPVVTTAIVRLSREFGIRWVRRPLAFPVLGPSLGLTMVRGGCRLTDHFAGYRLTGRLAGEALPHLIRRLPPGVTELMCHPGYLGSQLRDAPTRLKESRQRELEALTSPAAIAALRQTGAQLTSFRSLGIGR